jgi:hypothetical protein
MSTDVYRFALNSRLGTRIELREGQRDYLRLYLAEWLPNRLGHDLGQL